MIPSPERDTDGTRSGSLDTPPPPLPTVILISGRGSNMQAIVSAAGDIPAEIRAVISNCEDAPGLELARREGIPARVVDHRGFPDRASFDRALMACIDAYRPAVVVLAGFMRILGPAFVQHYRGRLLNIHPSLLPDYRGLDTHRRVLEAGERVHGASVHFVTDELDGGPVIVQARVPVHPADDPDGLAARVLEQEHRIYPLVLSWMARGRLRLEPDGVYLDQSRLSQRGASDPVQ
jgi:phosphoribosylglycinamide formyltransferase-1